MNAPDASVQNEFRLWKSMGWKITIDKRGNHYAEKGMGRDPHPRIPASRRVFLCAIYSALAISSAPEPIRSYRLPALPCWPIGSYMKLSTLQVKLFLSSYNTRVPD